MPAKPREVSSSDSESDSESQRAQEKRSRKRQHTKYHCPADFTVCDFRPCTSTSLESVNDGNKELWLIKAPLTFNPDSFSGVRFPTMGLETVQPHTRQQQVYSLLSRPIAPGNACLLTTAGRRPGDAFCAPAFSGVVNISESYGDCRGNQAPVPIPACPAPVIPGGLRQRFQPFGSRTTYVRGHEEEEDSADGPTPAKRVKTHPEQGETPKKKKKKKKDKRIKEEEEEEGMAVEEEVSVTASRGLTETPGEEAVEKKKKKKKEKSKDRDRGEADERRRGAEAGLSLKEEVVVKAEPVDLAYGDGEDWAKKRKVKKEKRRPQD
ncbi:CD3e molecule, epsilon associated protein [Conger conger]|uniref:CD3e molecule, epsilon associated protein n=1 Tax=Conger conger TaxID=82655 RepID=UPI002A5A5F7B|nr:CD3e molecule, epsilon associated protein [Conger conger]